MKINLRFFILGCRVIFGSAAVSWALPCVFVNHPKRHFLAKVIFIDGHFLSLLHFRGFNIPNRRLSSVLALWNPLINLILFLNKTIRWFRRLLQQSCFRKRLKWLLIYNWFLTLYFIIYFFVDSGINLSIIVSLFLIFATCIIVVDLSGISNFVYYYCVLISCSVIVIFRLEYFGLLILILTCLHGFLIFTIWSISLVVDLIGIVSDHWNSGSHMLSGNWSHTNYGISCALFILLLQIFKAYSRLFISVINSLGILNNFYFEVFLFQRAFLTPLMIIVLFIFWRF